MHVLALIPARGGSRGLPRKNVRLLGGRPLIAYSIVDARASRVITRVVVSTEDLEIAAVARQWGAEVPFRRPTKLAGHTTPDLPVFRHALQWLEKHEGYVPDILVHLRPSTPLREPSKLDEAIRLILDHPEADSVRSVSRPLQTPYKMWRVVGDYMEPLLHLPGVPEPYNLARQELPDVFRQDGYVDVIRASVVMKSDRMTGSKVLPFFIDDEVIDIDYEESLQQAEAFLAEKANGGVTRPRTPRHPA